MKIACVLLVLVGSATVAFAQISVSDFDGLTPVGLQPGSPAGSYALSGLDSVHLYNGSANITIPLLNIGGRGEAGYTMAANYGGRWNGAGILSTDAPCSPTSPCPLWTFQTSGWANWDYLYRPAGIAIRHLGQGSYTVYSNGYAQCDVYTGALTRITVGLADGTELTLVDSATSGAPMESLNCNPQGSNRGTTFVSTDGSAATFIADSPIYDVSLVGGVPQWEETGAGTLYFRDGRRFRFGVHILEGYSRTVIDWIQDRNGNRTTFDYPANPPSGFQYGFSVTDPLGRITNVAVGQPYTFDDPDAGCYGCTGRYDQITSSGASGQSRTMTVYRRGYWYDRVSSLQGAPPPTYASLFGGYASSTASPSDWAISKIVLPDGHSYQFHYTPYAEVARLDLPTGGRYEFDWENGPGVFPYDTCPSNDSPNQQCPAVRAPSGVQASLGLPTGYDLLIAVYRRVKERREYVDGGSSWTRRTTYSVSESNAPVSGDPVGRCGFVGDPNFESGYCTEVSVEEYDPAQGQLSSEAHYFYGAVSKYQSLFPQPGWYSWWLEGREFRTDVIQPPANTLRQQLQTWQYRAIPAWWSPNYGPLPGLDARVGGADLIIDGGKMTRKLLAYSPSPADNTNHVVDSREYDYGDTSGSQGTLIRRTHTDFVTTTNNPSAGVYLRDLPSNQTVYDGPGNTVAQTQYFYDESAVVGAPGIVQNVAVASQRGNLTRVLRWRNTDGEWLTATQSYDIAGNVMSVTNPRGYSTAYTYTDCPGKYAFVTTVSQPAGHTTTLGHDCSLGQITSITGPAGFQTTVEYGNSNQDVLDRISKIIRPNGQQTIYRYSADLTTVTAKSDQYAIGDQMLVSAAVNDGLGRTVETRIYTSPGNYIAAKKDLDALGRTRKAYNPGSATDGTSTTYDALGRVRTMTYADGSQEGFEWTTDTVLHTDPASKQRRQQVDALGRIVAITEDPSGQNLRTSYSYDAFGDLLTAIQGGQTRSFLYDSLQQLRGATNPEVGLAVSCLGQTVSECYSYDANGNLSAKEAAGVTATFTYDSLDRILRKTYSDGTPQVDYAYDILQKGCLNSVSSSAATMTFTAYNPNCLVAASRQTVGTQNYDFTYAYNLASALTQESYPSGRTVSYHYDAAGRTDRVGNGPLSGPNSYANGITYAPHGAMASMTLGVTSTNPGWAESWQYNNRLQPTSVNAGSGLLSLGFYYCPNGGSICATNNGNMLRQIITRGGTMWTQDYPTTGYDTMNRLTSAQETSAAGNWSQTYGYDRYGNWWLASYSPSLPGPNLETPQTQNWYLSNNRIAGWGYDGRGNVTSIQYMPRGFAYDGENRQTAASINGANASYSYDGEGRRIKKNVGLLTATYVYDAFDHLIAEYSNQTSSSGTQYRHVDHLGSTRLVTSASATPLQCHDFLPFGGELLAGIDGRGSCFPSAPSSGIEFTGKERDGETGLDYFEARYMSAAQGRFTSADFPLIDQDPSDPQSWNLYAYVRNNPLKYTDPTGQDCVYTDDIDSNGTVSVERGDCSRKRGTFVNGTLDLNSLTFDARKRTLGYSYSRSEDTIGTGVINLPGLPGDELDAKGLAFAGAMAARVDASNKAIEAFAVGTTLAGIGVGVAPIAAQAINEVALGPAAGRLFFEGEAGYKLTTTWGMGRLLSESPLGQQYRNWGEPLGRFGWGVLSRFWASGASGTANIFPSFTNHDSFLWKTELPILLSNPNVFRLWH